MVKFSEAVDLFCKYIKTVLILFIVNILIGIPITLITALLSVIPGLGALFSTVFMIVTTYASILTFIECQKNGDITFSNVIDYYSQGLNNLGDIIRASVAPLLKMLLFVIIISVVYFSFIFGAVLAMKANSDAGFLFVSLFILTLFAYVILVVGFSLKYSIEMFQKLSCVYFDDTEYKFYEEYKGKTPISRYFWFFIPFLGQFAIYLAVTKEAIEYYEGV